MKGIVSSFLLGICERPKHFKPVALYKVEKVLEFLPAFSRMAHYHRSAECNPRNCCPDVVYELLGFLVIHTPPHHGEDLG